MSITHLMRQQVEELFKRFLEKTGLSEEATVYAVFIPKEEEVDEESVDVFEQRVNPKDAESVENFVSRLTKVALENDVKELKLYALVLDRDGETLIIAREENPEADEVIKELIERMKEEV
ncbi:hypothetical protein [Aquifex aeolicus]|uniref:Uncharacterized protein aq_2063 n=1 Tax=Aquifex aeolicus (strain VF5) TaxID=224324 RepID=Y2063_AQUAE|nr:hypothetical protein [Aquifex aeolicus]O67844.1 RecName: Full=Uncharacterized protein aq_2063 [Aquifex aeolicus VF5]AAC07807.1 putative protein [Aquifex aeolicus VF5]